MMTLSCTHRRSIVGARDRVLVALRLRGVDLVLDQLVPTRRLLLRRRRLRRVLRSGRGWRESAGDDHLAALVVRVEVGGGERAGEDLVVLVAEADVAQDGAADLNGTIECDMMKGASRVWRRSSYRDGAKILFFLKLRDLWYVECRARNMT